MYFIVTEIKSRDLYVKPRQNIIWSVNFEIFQIYVYALRNSIDNMKPIVSHILHPFFAVGLSNDAAKN